MTIPKTNFSVIIKHLDDIPLKDALGLRKAISKAIEAKGYHITGEGFDLQTNYLDIGFRKKTFTQDESE